MWLSNDGPRRICAVVCLAAALGVTAAQGPGEAGASSTMHDATTASTTTTTTTTATTPTTAAHTTPPTTAMAAQSTCESRTINYITHTLPQQCLTSSPTPAPESSSVASSPQTAPAGAGANGVAQPPQGEPELDSDGNDLSTGSFLSFDEWKSMMLEKSGQDPLEARPRKAQDGRADAYPGGDLDALGEEGEIALDFDAYTDKISEITSDAKPRPREKDKEEAVEKVSYDEGLAQVYRSKDAGKTCKERFSYSSFDAGATVLKTSPGAKNPKALLVENKDSYMLLECSMENKFFIVELSDDILVDTVVLANFEFFSSMIRQFRVSVSDRYPVKLDKWKVLGEYHARNSRDIQPFLIENPQIWARYLRIEILSHYGNEYYCPISLLRVHGTRMLDSWKEADPSDAEAEIEVEAESSKPASEGAEVVVETTEAVVEEVELPQPTQVEYHTVVMEQSDWVRYWDKSYFDVEYDNERTCEMMEFLTPTSTWTEEEDGTSEPENPQPSETPEEVSRAATNNSPGASAKENSAMEQSHTITSIPSKTPSDSVVNTADPTAVSIPSTAEGTEAGRTPSPQASSTFTTPVTRPSQPPSPKNKTIAATSLKAPSSKSTIVKPASGGSQATMRNKTTTTTTSASASPTVQDSFFKQLTKRLQTLESNTTLSLQYIELQSKFLQEALSKLERRQVAKVDLFLDTLNQTVLSELREVRTQYDQIWQSTVIALETQREQSEREIVALSSRLGLLADEVVFQKRMAIVQSVLLLGCLVLVIFSRNLANAGMDALYYPSQFLPGASSSRLASPLFPSTPKATSAATAAAAMSTPPSANHHRPGPGGTHVSNGKVNGSQRRTLGDGRSSLETQHRKKRLLHPDDGNSRRRRPPPNARTVSEPSGGDYYNQPPTPTSLELGYDSEPTVVPTRDYFSSGSADDGGRDDEDGESTYVKMPANRSDRQVTPSSEPDGYEYIQRVARPPMPHVGSARKPLPALPEDPDPD